MKWIFFLVLFLSSLFLHAHPGIGIVMDAQGNIYYTDLEQVWKLSPDGKQSVAVPNVHTHELYLDMEGNLYGEHLWYEGEVINKWGHYVWCLKHDGTVTKVIPATEGFLTNYSFVRDREGSMYWVDRGDTCYFRKIDTTGKVSTIANGIFTDVRWMYCSPKDRIYFIDLKDLITIEPDGRFTVLAKNLQEKSLAFGLFAGDRHNVTGIWSDKLDNLYVAVFGGQKIKRIKPDGTVTVVATSQNPWSPTGGVFDEQGNLWVLEYSLTNTARVRKIEAASLGDTHLNIRDSIANIALPLGGVILFALMIILLLRLKKNKKISSK